MTKVAPESNLTTASTYTEPSLGNQLCVVCNQSYAQSFHTFGACDHQICDHCYSILIGLPQREKVCPICKKGKDI